MNPFDVFKPNVTSIKEELLEIPEHKLLKTTLCAIEKKYGKEKARQAEIYLTQNFIMTFSTKELSQPWSFMSKKECEYNIKEGEFRDDRNNKIYKIEDSKNTNPKYPNFIQAIFTAGDREQFEKYGIQQLKGNFKDKTTMKKIKTTFEYIFTYLKKGIFVEIYNNKISVFLPFNNANFRNTWYKNLKAQPYKKVKGQNFMTGYNPGEITERLIERGDLSNRSQLLTQQEIIRRYTEDGYPPAAIQAYELFPRREIIKDMSKWYANNCIFRNNLRTNLVDEFGNPLGVDEYGGPAGEIDEGDKTIANLLEILAVTCLHKRVNDSVFFMNYRDFPCTRLNSKKQLIHPYEALFFPSRDTPLIKLHNKPLKITDLLPIFSQSISRQNGDTLFIDEDEIEEMLPAVTKPNCREYTPPKTIPWNQKRTEANFRGSLTGCGTEIWNPRLQIAAISYILNETNFTPKLDAKLTDIKKRFKKDPLKEFTDFNNPSKKVDPKLFGNNNVKPFYVSKLYGKKQTDTEQQKYKYVIMVEGFVSPFRLARQLSWGSLVITVPSKWKLWFETKNCAIPPIKFGTIENGKLIGGNVNEIQGLRLKMITKNCKDSRSLFIHGNTNKTTKCPAVSIIDTKQLRDTLKWCQRNDNLAKQIAEQGKQYYETYLNKNKMMDYVACKLNKME